MTMPDCWYKTVSASEALTQGDIILECAVSGWPLELDVNIDENDPERIKDVVQIFRRDIVVMTQACDLEHRKVAQVIACPCYALSEYKTTWEEQRQNEGKNHSTNELKGFLKQIKDGRFAHLAILDSGVFDNSLSTEHRIVDFSEIYSIPRIFLDSLISKRGGYRLTLLPPYREHLSQSFARFFMRVGLPTNVSDFPI